MGEHLLGYVIEFSDGGDPEGGILARGTRAHCEEVARLVPAVAYSGRRPVARAYMKVVPAADVETGVAAELEPARG